MLIIVVLHRGDVNKDDKLDAAELKDFYTHDEDQYHGHAISKAFGGDDKATARLDTNKDGETTLELARHHQTLASHSF